jgi:hypothetical protein
VGVKYRINRQCKGRKHVLGIAEGASDNQTVARGLLRRLVAQGLDPQSRWGLNECR